MDFDDLKNLKKVEFDAIYISLYPSLLAYAKKFVSSEDAEEIVQDVMVWFWENRKIMVFKTTLKGYLFRSIRNNCLTRITQLEAQQRLHQKVYDQLQHVYEDPDFYQVEELTQKIESALKKLPETYRIAFEKNRFENKTYNEIAQELGVSSKTVDYRISQSLKLLRKELKEYLPLLVALLS